MKTSAGIAIILKGEKILLAHPTNSAWMNTYSVPKGEINKGEDVVDAAIRETREETSIVVTKDKLDIDHPILIDYINKDKKLYKRLYIYRCLINDISELNIQSEVIPASLIDIKENDWAGFLNKEDASSKIFWRQKELLNLLIK